MYYFFDILLSGTVANMYMEHRSEYLHDFVYWLSKLKDNYVVDGKRFCFKTLPQCSAKLFGFMKEEHYHTNLEKCVQLEILLKHKLFVCILIK